jgi:hypothetical protein
MRAGLLNTEDPWWLRAMRATEPLDFDPTAIGVKVRIRTLGLIEGAAEGGGGFLGKRAPIWSAW